MAKKVIFFLNSIVALGSILYFIIADIPPSKQLMFNGFSLLFPLLLVAHFIFISFWLVKLDKRMLLSLFIVFAGYKYMPRFFAFNAKQTPKANNKEVIKIATYNTLNFRKQKLKNNAKEDNIFNLLDFRKVEIVGLQEAAYYKNSSYLKTNFNKRVESQSWIYSKHTAISNGHLEVLSSNKRKDITYLDVVKKADTIRVYNLHFQSYKFSKDPKSLREKGLITSVEKIKKGFLVHEKEVDILIKHIKTSPYPTIVMGDFNNNAFSYEYNRLLKECDLKDTFVEAGSGFGSTFDFKYFPTRIDFILVPQTAKVYSHKVLKLKDWSDHYPVIAEISL